MMTLEKEFEQAKKNLMYRVVGLASAEEYVKQQLSGVTIPYFMVDMDELKARAMRIGAKAVCKLEDEGLLGEAFTEAWDRVQGQFA